MVPLQFQRYPEEEMRQRADAMFADLERRRSVRFFSDEPIPLDVVRRAVHVAGQAPSGAHKQPWRFVLVTDPQIKREIRLAAEAEERETYAHRMSEEWREALRPIGTDWQKPFLETVPAIVVVFRVDYGVDEDGNRSKNYYVQESVGLAAGMLIAALHHAGLATLTHTPSPMNFLAKILRRPTNERAFLLLPVGYPSADCVVPDFDRKPLDEILVEV
ncbi:MAG: nitroreductase family protein [Myxococcales bacterium FL481]|nr:MAG: nitroreductase family protein [Myxococcales bacterium FL481]